MPWKSLVKLFLQLDLPRPYRTVRFASHSLAILREAAVLRVDHGESALGRLQGVHVRHPRSEQDVAVKVEVLWLAHVLLPSPRYSYMYHAGPAGGANEYE